MATRLSLVLVWYNSIMRPDLRLLATPLYRLLDSSPGPVKSPAICGALGIADSELRELVNYLRRQGRPGMSNIASDSNGYWIARTPADVFRTERQVYGRFEPMRKAMVGLRRSMSMPLTQQIEML